MLHYLKLQPDRPRIGIELASSWGYTNNSKPIRIQLETHSKIKIYEIRNKEQHQPQRFHHIQNWWFC